MFALLSDLLGSADEVEWAEHVRDFNAGRLAERTQVLASLHKLNTLVGQAIRRIEETTYELSSLLYKRKKKSGLKGASQTSKQRFCVFRPDGLHYHEVGPGGKGGKRLGVIELSSVEACDFVEGSEKTFVITRSNSEIVEFTAESPAVAREWIAVLKPKVLVVVLEGHLLKKKIRNGKAVSMGKMRWVVLTKDSFKVFEEKGGRCMNSFDLDEVNASHVRDGEASAMKIQLPDGTTYLFFSPAESDPGLPLEWVNSISRSKIGRRSQKPGVSRASSSSNPEKALVRSSVDSKLAQSKPQTQSPSRASHDGRVALSSSASSTPKEKSPRQPAAISARSSMPEVTRTSVSASKTVAAKAAKTVPKYEEVEDEIGDEDLVAPVIEDLGTTTEMIAEIEAAELRMERLMTQGPPQKRLPKAPPK